MLATTKNQLQDTNNDFVYDAAGNLIQPVPSGGTYTFDAENHLISVGGVAYLYDGDGKRVGKAPASTPTQPNYLYWYGTGSQILEETDGTGNYAYLDAYFNGMLLARGEADNWVDHFFADALGNTRVVYGDNDPDGGSSDYYPFGGERPIPTCCPTNPGGVNVPFKFTGKERDSESGLDNSKARFYSSQWGRFMSPDPTGGVGDDPQSLNKYSYVINNPLRYDDPLGLWHCELNNGQTVEGASTSKECHDMGGDWWVSDPGDIPNGFGRMCESETCQPPLQNASLPASGNDEMGEWAAALPMAAKIAEPGVNVASAGLMLFGAVIAPPAAAGPVACAALGCGKGEWAFAAFPLLSEGPTFLGSPATRSTLLAVVKNQKLRNIIELLYRPGATVGDGGTADAIRQEIKTGIQVGGKWHVSKGLQIRSALRKLLRAPGLDPADRAIAKRLLTDLQSALSSGKWPH
jgi:RHS repeat-associated protein